MITSLLEADMAEQYKYYYDLEWMQKHPKLYRIVDIWLFICYWVMFNTVCRIKGHDLVDEGYATPDSGCINMSCKRCGYSWPTHWLY